MEEKKKLKEQALTHKGPKVDKDLECFVLPDIDNWTGYMGGVWDNKKLPLRNYPHRNLEKESEYWESTRQKELQDRANGIHKTPEVANKKKWEDYD
jgi:hypothetical protein